MTPEQLHAHSIALEAKVLGLTTILVSILKHTPGIKLNELEIYDTIQNIKGESKGVAEIRQRAKDVAGYILRDFKP